MELSYHQFPFPDFSTESLGLKLTSSFGVHGKNFAHYDTSFLMMDTTTSSDVFGCISILCVSYHLNLEIVTDWEMKFTLMRVKCLKSCSNLSGSGCKAELYPAVNQG